MSDNPNRRDFLKASVLAATLPFVGEVAAAPPAKKAEKHDPVAERKELVESLLALLNSDPKTTARLPEKFKDAERLEKQATSRIDQCESDGHKHYMVTAFGDGHAGEEPNATSTTPAKSSANKQLSSRLLVVDKETKNVTLKEGKGGTVTVEIDGKELLSTHGSTKGQPVTFTAKDHVSIVAPGRDSATEPLEITLAAVPPLRLDVLNDHVTLGALKLPELSKPAASFTKYSQIFTHGSGTVRLNISDPQLFATTYIAAAKKVSGADASGHYIGVNLVVGGDAKGAQAALVQFLPSRYNEVSHYSEAEKIREPKNELGELQFQLKGQDVSTPVKIGRQVGVDNVVPPSLDVVAQGVEASSQQRTNALGAIQWLLDQRFQMENGKPVRHLKGGLQAAKEGEYTMGAFADQRINQPLQQENLRGKFKGFDQALAR